MTEVYYKNIRVARCFEQNSDVKLFAPTSNELRYRMNKIMDDILRRLKSEKRIQNLEAKNELFVIKKP